MVKNGEFKFKELNWQQRKELKKILEAEGKTFARILKDMELPIDFVEKAFVFGIEGFEDVEQLNKLNELQLMTGASEVLVRTFVKPEQEKKS